MKTHEQIGIEASKEVGRVEGQIYADMLLYVLNATIDGLTKTASWPMMFASERERLYRNAWRLTGVLKFKDQPESMRKHLEATAQTILSTAPEDRIAYRKD